MYGEPTVMPTPENYGPILPIALYAASKVACESLITAYAHNYDITAWIYRFGNIVGPNPTHGVIHDFVLRLREDPTRLVVLGDGTQAKPYVYVEDCLDGMEFGIPSAEHVRAQMAVDDQTSVREITTEIEAMGYVQRSASATHRRQTATAHEMARRRAEVQIDTGVTALGWRPKRQRRPCAGHRRHGPAVKEALVNQAGRSESPLRGKALHTRH